MALWLKMNPDRPLSTRTKVQTFSNLQFVIQRFRFEKLSDNLKNIGGF